MTTLNDFKALRASVPAEVQRELFSLFSRDPEASFQRMVDIAAEKGVTLTVDEVKGFLKQWIRRRSLTILSWMLLPSLLWLVAGRNEVAVKPWGRCPGMCPMRKWLFGRQPVAES